MSASRGASGSTGEIHPSHASAPDEDQLFLGDGHLTISPGMKESPPRSSSSGETCPSKPDPHASPVPARPPHGVASDNRNDVTELDAVRDEAGSFPQHRSHSATPSSVDTSPRSASDLAEVKATATRLNLTTRRSSYTEWLHFYLGKRLSCPQFALERREKDGKLTTERKQRIDKALEWLRGELLAMRRQDQALARQLLSLRQDIQQMRLRRTSLQHQAMLDELSSQLEDLGQLPEPLDLPAESLSDPRLQQLGVTRMNLSQRRFSTS